MQPRWPTAAIAFVLGAALLAATPAGAVVTTVTTDSGGSEYQLVLRVGASAGVDAVTFQVEAEHLDAAARAVHGSPAIDVWVEPLRPPESFLFATTEPRWVTLTVDASEGLQCESGGCGGTTIPFSQIGWVASNTGDAASGDIRSGRFSGSVAQQIGRFDANATACFLGVLCAYGTRQLQQTRMHFYYANEHLYPAGRYRGRVRYTATLQ